MMQAPVEHPPLEHPPVEQPAGSVDWSAGARYFEYHLAADPLRTGTISPVPVRRFAPGSPGTTGIVELDLSDVLGTPWPATSPALLASFVNVAAGSSVRTAPVATSELFFVVRGEGDTTVDEGTLVWGTGDLFVLPNGLAAEHRAATDAVLYRVTDEPLLAHLGVAPTRRRFRPTHFTRDELERELDRVAAAPDAAARNRIAVLLGTAEQAQTLTVTHTLWAMLGLVPVGAVQRPHRHQSVALDLVVDCRPGCYSLVGDRIEPSSGEIVDPVRVDWEPGAAFVTPPGLWHSHHNESGRAARILPIQDAGLHTYLRSLDIRFQSGPA
jgi:gentisate 1,2-dioxygenase